MTAKSPNNPYRHDQVPECQLWEQVNSSLAMAQVHENEAATHTRRALAYHKEAAAFEAALAKLRPPEGEQP